MAVGFCKPWRRMRRDLFSGRGTSITRVRVHAARGSTDPDLAPPPPPITPASPGSLSPRTLAFPSCLLHPRLLTAHSYP